jgi:hypothetical protein
VNNTAAGYSFGIPVTSSQFLVKPTRGEGKQNKKVKKKHDNKAQIKTEEKARKNEEKSNERTTSVG